MPAFAAVVAVSVALAGCDIAVNGDGGFNFDLAAGKAQDTWTRSYPLGKDGRLEIINVNGRITAEATDGTSVEVVAERTAKASTDDSAKDLLKQIEMREEVGRRPRPRRGPRAADARRVRPRDQVDAQGPARRGRRSPDHQRRRQDECASRAKFAPAPPTAASPATPSNATALDASTTNGGVEIELTRAVSTGTFELQAVNGGVSLTMPSDSKADLTAKCVNGGITLDGLDLKVSGESMSNPNEFEQHVEGAKKFRRRLEGQLNGGGARVSLDTVNGGVKILRTSGDAGNESRDWGSGIRDQGDDWDAGHVTLCLVTCSSARLIPNP